MPYPFSNKEYASQMGKKAWECGLTPKRYEACIQNPLKNGVAVKHPKNREKFLPTAEEKASGITKKDKIESIKKISKALYCTNVEEFIDGLEHEMYQFNVERLVARQNNLIDKDKQIYWHDKAVGRLVELGKLKFGLGTPQVQNNITVDKPNKMSIGDLVLKFSQKKDKIIEL